MKRFRDFRLATKLVWVTLGTSFVVLAAAVGALVSYEISSSREDLLRTTSTQADIIAFHATSALLFDDAEAATTTLRSAAAEPVILEAAIYAADGRRFASHLPSGAAESSLPVTLEETEERSWTDGDRLVVLRPIESAGRSVGTLALVATLAEVEARMIRYLEIAAVVFGLSIGFAFVISFVAQRVVSQPILDLVDTARRISAEQNYALRATPAGEDEVGILIRSFNAMLGHIQGRDAALERARDEAEAGNRAKDEFLATVSHELRTPLTPILSWVALLKTDRLDPTQRARALEGIDRNARAQAQLVADLLDVSRIISGKLHLDVRTVEVEPLVDAAIDALRPAAQAKQITVEFLPRPCPWLVTADPDRLQQVLWNLISNAVKFTPAGGRVAITCRPRDEWLEIVVEDTGPGIPPDFLAHVFDRFRQVDSSTTRKHGGLGLGLSIVKHIVELHGGTVRAENGDVRGARITIDVPLVLRGPAVAAPVEPTRSDRRLPADSLSGIRILVVDDEPDTLETLRATLGACGADVRVAASAAEATTILDEWIPHVLVSDLAMPGEDGYGLIRRVRERPVERGGGLPALALTAYARTEDRLKALAAGFQMHVAKPVDPADLVAVVSALAGWSGGRLPA